MALSKVSFIVAWTLVGRKALIGVVLLGFFLLPSIMLDVVGCFVFRNMMLCISDAFFLFL